jgi:hypothetical protein
LVHERDRCGCGAATWAVVRCCCVQAKCSEEVSAVVSCMTAPQRLGACGVRLPPPGPPTNARRQGKKMFIHLDITRNFYIHLTAWSNLYCDISSYNSEAQGHLVPSQDFLARPSAVFPWRKMSGYSRRA